MKKILTLIVTCFIVIMLSAFDVKTELEPLSIVVIVHKDNPVSSLTASEVRLYYLRKIKKRWPELDKNIRPVDRKKSCEERDAFYSILRMNSVQIDQYFGNKQLQNAERPPDKFATEADVINFVSEEVGSIGYIKASSITPEVLKKIKIVYVLSGNHN